MVSIIDGYRYVYHELRDQRTKNFFLLGGPFEIIFIVGVYIKFVNDWGPSFMKNREPFKLKNFLIVYNLFQIIFNTFLFVFASKYTFLGDYNLFCQPIGDSNTPNADLVIIAAYLYFLAKIIDLLDTVVFVLRKKQNQISFLHKYHHISMCLITHIGMVFFPGGHGLFFGVVNSFVHAVMYFYYLVALLDREGKYTWWKKHLTQLQIAQFCIVALHWLSLLVYPSCGYPRWLAVIALPFNAAIMILFINFYYHTYIKKKKVS